MASGFCPTLKPQPFFVLDNNGVSNGDCLSMAKSKVVREAIKMLEENEQIIKRGFLEQGLLQLNSTILKLLRES
jgi:hypothetical protein